MSQFEVIFLGIWFVLLIGIIGYWGNLAWFHPGKLNGILKQDAQRRPNRLLIMRVVTLIGALSMVILGIMFLLSLAK